jgi:hypothetical protein
MAPNVGALPTLGDLMLVKPGTSGPHIDLKMKLHKKLNKDCPARTNAE